MSRFSQLALLAAVLMSACAPPAAAPPPGNSPGLPTVTVYSSPT